MSSIKKYTLPTPVEIGNQQTVSLAAEIEKAFSEKCCFYIICAYHKALEEGKLQTSWEEETITAHLAKHIEKCLEEAGEEVFLQEESAQKDKEIADGIKSPKKRIWFDLILATFYSKKKVVFGLEAKILVEGTFNKRTESAELGEYVSIKGMRKFIEGKYTERGCMVGYIVQGNAESIVSKLNERIKKHSAYRRDEVINGKHTINGYQYCYWSGHPSIYAPELKHLMLVFN